MRVQYFGLLGVYVVSVAGGSAHGLTVTQALCNAVLRAVGSCARGAW